MGADQIMSASRWAEVRARLDADAGADVGDLVIIKERHS
jgi:hypothetical protein